MIAGFLTAADPSLVIAVSHYHKLVHHGYDNRCRAHRRVPVGLWVCGLTGLAAIRELRATLGVLHSEEDGDGSGLSQLDSWWHAHGRQASP